MRLLGEAVLRVMVLSHESNYAMYHHVLSRAAWSGLEVIAILLRLPVKTFDRGGPLMFGVDRPLSGFLQTPLANGTHLSPRP
jgi:hypothetical protein